MQIKIIGAGLAGCEAALWLADHGVQVDLYEQKPVKFSPAHKSAGFAELICSNSLKAERPDSASGLLKIEMRMMGSHLLDAAETARVAAGGALAVDRDVFSTAVTEMVEKNSGITVHREEVTALDESVPVLVASGPLRPVGLRDPRTGHRPWANVQLRAENTARTLYNIVGFQTNLKWGEQKRVFSMIPGLEHAEFIRYGVMHRNTFLESPAVLTKGLYLKEHPNVFFAGQITGFEGYMESAASGLLAARNLYARLQGRELPPPPTTTMCGALIDYITTPNKDFQPMGANMGILPRTEEIDTIRDKRERYMALSDAAQAAMRAWAAEAEH